MTSSDAAFPADITIVGGGATGVLLAAQLVRKSRLRMAIIEKCGEPGLGVAYSTRCLGHLLNVRASDMSALDDEPDHFVQWLIRDGGGFGRTDFVPRADYGRYLRDLLADAVHRSEGRLEVVSGEVVAARERNDRVEIELADGMSLLTRTAVLATGHRPPSDSSGAYHGNPWREAAIDGLAPDASVLLIGTSLTMIDVLVSLLESRHTGPIVALSRRGLVPHSHPPRPIPSPEVDTRSLFTGPLSKRTSLFRSIVREGVGWPGLMQLLRPHNNDLWLGLDLDQRRRFLRHLRPWWDIHRHRVAPQVGEIIEAARARGQLEVLAAKVEIEGATDRTVDVSVVRRGTSTAERRTFDRVIDCRGPRNEVDERLPLHAQMVADGLLRPDMLDQGLDVSLGEALIGCDGRPSRSLFALGPPTRGRYTEIVAIPDIRIQAASLAAHLVALLGAPSGLDGKPAA